MKKQLYILTTLAFITPVILLFTNFLSVTFYSGDFVSWTNWRNMYWSTFKDKRLSLEERGYYLDDIEIYESTDNKKLFTGIWTEKYSELVLNKTRK